MQAVFSIAAMNGSDEIETALAHVAPLKVGDGADTEMS
jgi:hypothetical protein